VLNNIRINSIVKWSTSLRISWHGCLLCKFRNQ